MNKSSPPSQPTPSRFGSLLICTLPQLVASAHFIYFPKQGCSSLIRITCVRFHYRPFRSESCPVQSNPSFRFLYAPLQFFSSLVHTVPCLVFCRRCASVPYHFPSVPVRYQPVCTTLTLIPSSPLNTYLYHVLYCRFTTMLFQFLPHHVLCRRFTAVPSLVRSLHDIPLRSLPRLLASERVSSQSSLASYLPIQVPFYHHLSMSIPHTLLLFRFSSFMTTPCQHNWSPCISDSRQLKSFLIQCISDLGNSHSFPSIRSYPYHLRYFPGRSIPFLVLS